jgi:hypothetical protein
MKLRAWLHIDTRRRPQGFAGHGEGRISQRRPERNSLAAGRMGCSAAAGLRVPGAMRENRSEYQMCGCAPRTTNSVHARRCFRVKRTQTLG